MTFQNRDTYNLNYPDLSSFITSTQIDEERQNVNLFYNFLKDLIYDLDYGDKKSSRYNIIKYLFQPQLGSGLDQYTELHTSSRGTSPIYIVLPSDPNEAVDQLKLSVLEKV